MFPRHLNPTYSQSKFTSPGLQCLPCFLVFSSVASFAPSVSFAQMLLELITFCSWCSTLNSMADYNFVQWLINVDFQGISPEDFKSHHWSAHRAVQSSLGCCVSSINFRCVLCISGVVLMLRGQVLLPLIVIHIHALKKLCQFWLLWLSLGGFLGSWRFFLWRVSE